MKVVSLKKSAAERKSEIKQAYPSDSPENEGIFLHLDHHHLEKMGLGGDLKSGGKFTIKGRGQVESSESRSGKDGERHSARLRLTHAGIVHEPDGDEAMEDKKALRGEIEKAASAAETKAARK